MLDLSKLSDDEIELLERLLLKAAGEPAPTFRIEREFIDAADDTVIVCEKRDYRR